MESIVLANGVEMPRIGYGTWKLPSGAGTTDAVLKAIENGYRLIDCAYSYGNDFFVGKAIKSCGIEREKLFIVNKLWNDFKTEEEIISSCKKSLKLMKLDYFDLYLIHWPVTGANCGQINSLRWKTLEKLYKMGLTRAIGVSNFSPEQIEELGKVEILPMVNQIEFHPGCNQEKTLKFCKEKHIAVQGWSPLGSGEVFSNATLVELSKKYNKSVAQICLRWAFQHQVVPIPRTEDIDQIKENIDIFSFNIFPQDMQKIDAINNIASKVYKF